MLRGIVLVAIVGTAVACWPAWAPAHAVRVPKLVVLGVAGAAAAAWMARRVRDGAAVTWVDVGLLVYLAAGGLSAIVHGRLWTLGAGWAAQELAAVVLVGAASAIARERGGAAWSLRVIVAAACGIAALAIVEALGAVLPIDGARPTATLGNRDWVATYLVIAVPIAMAWVMARGARGSSARVVRALPLALLVIAIVITRCRGAWLSLIGFVVLAAVVVAIARGRGPWSVRGAGVAMAVIAAAIAIAVIVPWPGLRWSGSAPYWSSLERVAEVDAGTGRTRAVQFPVAAAIVADHPILGVGPGQWHDAFDAHAHAAPDHHVEGAYGTPAPFAALVRVATETGLLGLLGLVIAAIGIARAARARWRDGDRSDDLDDAATRLTIGASIGALVTAQAIGLSQPILYQPETLVLVAILLGSVRTSAGVWHRAVPPRVAQAALVATAAFVLVIPLLATRAALPDDPTRDDLRASLRGFPTPQVAELLVFRETERLTLGPEDRAACAAIAAPLADAIRWSPHHVALHYRAAHCARVAGDLRGTRRWLDRIMAIEPHMRPQVEALAVRLGVPY